MSNESRSINSVLTDITAGAQRLSIATRSWPAFLPRASALEEAQNVLTGLQRSISELRSRLEANNAG